MQSFHQLRLLLLQELRKAAQRRLQRKTCLYTYCNNKVYFCIIVSISHHPTVPITLQLFKPVVLFFLKLENLPILVWSGTFRKIHIQVLGYQPPFSLKHRVKYHQCKIQKNWCTVTVAPTIEHHGGHSRTLANQRWDQVQPSRLDVYAKNSLIKT